MEKYYYFRIGKERYCLVVVRKLFQRDYVTLFTLDRKSTLGGVIPIDRVRTSTLKELFEHWFLLIKLKLAKHRRKQNSKAICSKP